MTTADPDRHRAVSRLLAATARAHHEATGGPNADWARWYAEHMHGEIGEALGTTPDVDTLAEWLIDADVRYRAEEPEAKWPTAYADWLVEWADGSAG